MGHKRRHLLAFQATPELHEAIRVAARARDVSKSRVIRDAIAEALGVERPRLHQGVSQLPASEDRRTIQGREAER